MDRWLDWFDDKTQVIIAVLVLTILAMIMLPESASNHIDAALTGLFGIAIGARVK